MEEKIYKYAPMILLFGGLIMLLVTLLLESYYNYGHYGYDLAWGFYAIIQILIATALGGVVKKLHQQVHIDVLTGLHNRRYFSTKLYAIQAQTPISLLLIDIDNFKGINDTYGHLAGDQVLRQFAEILQSSIRKSDIDIVARWGGEEFAVILPRTGAKEAFKIADRIRTIVENHLFSYGSIACKITVSIGIASTKEGADIDMEQLIKISDEALYKAKEKRNYVYYCYG
ncbi:GGDEF domain-containing protein [Moorella sp. Hama-1]|uniref:GGDEF domain-containing protein n=1 Tax=Moorella sp. Hama-1 TaxID=2138101 RepID=UPI000D64618F|nr:GGDEF domain-containing protein [Moorella sp. Hama-1]BCV22810.1 GGDEF domain-containing protein [Moorella sp. Hama-1]